MGAIVLSGDGMVRFSGSVTQAFLNHQFSSRVSITPGGDLD
jgi:hypothetical protein